MRLSEYLHFRERCRMSTMASVEAIPVLYIVAKNNYDVGYTIGSTIKRKCLDDELVCSRRSFHLCINAKIQV